MNSDHEASQPDETTKTKTPRLADTSPFRSMGIKDLNELIRSEVPKAVYTHPLSAWRGLRMAVDVSTLVYADYSIAWGGVVASCDVLVDEPRQIDATKTFYDLFLKSCVLRLLRCGVTPVLVFDGVSPPEKDGCRRERATVLARALSKLETTRTEMRSRVLQVSPTEVDRLRRCYRAVARPPKELEASLFSVCCSLGLPTYRSKTEAERLCSWMSRQGLVSAVYSSDTDALVHGTQVLVNRNAPGLAFDDVHVTELAVVLGELALAHDEFVDLCIMLGCDYNRNIKGIGRVGALKLIRQYRCLDNLPASYDTTCLRSDACYRLFDTSVDISELYDGELGPENMTVDADALTRSESRRFLSSLGLDHWCRTLAPLYSQVIE